MYALLMHIITELYEQQKKINTGQPQWLPLFTQLQDELCKKMKLASELARLYNLPEKVFLKEFKDFFGCTPKAFPNKKRVDKGYELLMTTDLTVSEIACECGFADDSKFVREFKLRYKLSPDVYRMVHTP
jgi:AraC family transcriptional regulator